MEHKDNLNDGRNADEKRMLTGMFRDRNSAESVYNSMDDRGYSPDENNLVEVS